MKTVVCDDETVAGSYDWNDWASIERSRLFMSEKLKFGMTKYMELEGL
jgi:hypothetical protein